jgi:NADH pyrophosphatase NudC (nudix superfamily)
VLSAPGGLRTEHALHTRAAAEGARGRPIAEQGSWSQQCQYCNDQGAALLGMNDYQERQDWASHCRSCGYDQYGVGLV